MLGPARSNEPTSRRLQRILVDRESVGRGEAGDRELHGRSSNSCVTGPLFVRTMRTSPAGTTCGTVMWKSRSVIETTGRARWDAAAAARRQEHDCKRRPDHGCAAFTVHRSGSAQPGAPKETATRHPFAHVESRPMDETWRNELSEFLAIPSVSADPAHREDVKQAGEWVCDFIRRIGGTAELTPFGEKELALGDIPASTDPENAPTVLVLRALRRAAACAARPLGERAVRAHDQGRVGVRARHRRRQGPALHPAEGGAEARRGERATRQPALRVRRRGGDRRSHDRRLPQDRRARRERGDHLRRRHGAHGRAGVRSCDARPHRLRRQGDDGRARSALRHVRRRRAERDPRAHADLRSGHRRPERIAARAAARRASPRRRRRSSRAGRRCPQATTSCRRKARARSIRTRRSSSTSGRWPSPPPT